MATRNTDTARAQLIQISKVLSLEARKGYGDSAASQGIARFVRERVARLGAGVGSDDRRLLQRLDGLFAGYAVMSEGERRRSIDDASRIVEDLLAATPSSSRSVLSPGQAASTPVATVRQPPTRERPLRRRVARSQVKSLADSVRLLPGVGEGRAAQLELLGVRTVGDLTRLYPRRHDDYSNIQPIASVLFGRATTIQGIVQSIETHRTATGKQVVSAIIADETGRINVMWFNPFVARQLAAGARVSLAGRVEQMRGTLCLKSPEWELLDDETLHTGRLIPVYPLVKNLYQKSIRPLARAALDATRGMHEEFLPPDLLLDEGLIGIADAIEWIHFPDGATPRAARQNLDAARRRLAFEEFLALQLGLLQRKHAWQSQPGTAFAIDIDALRRFGESLPFTLTRAQRRSLSQVMRDMAHEQPMTRLLQGDVGSGKTVIAAAAALIAIRAGQQVAVMAPTEILAEQHHRTIRALFDAMPEDLQPRIGFLSGSVSGQQRDVVYLGLREGTIDLVIGTHALIQEPVAFNKLGLAIVDEQHRFGVEQRARLRARGQGVDVLVMTATPIPRTLALTLHGDLDVSTIDELPPGRQPIETRWLPERQRGEGYAFIREQVALGRQAFIIFPLVEESEAVDARAAVDEHERLSRDVFPDLRVGLLHGRMRTAQKDEVMLQFRDREIDILVSTSVVEVGIDVPNATVMMIDGADRFGLSQLHQFRGRVGRGAERSYCLLVAGDVSSDGRSRLQAMIDSQDGFRLAQIDLELRGPGDFIGTRQSGLPELQLASFADVRDLERARRVAEQILAEDPELATVAHTLLRRRMESFWASATLDVS
ncbi:MAG TPA: ATP-dependent DNA helicase RecG [Thermomicrobiales bacterium]|nr:ATP-dependent DNA helicase RecG [Thermomicrobiales bacterium]